MHSGRVLVGRGEELARIDSCLTRARSGQASSLVLLGNPGIGKTALLDEAARRATTSGLRVVRVVALETESTIPHAALGISLPLLGRTAVDDSPSALLDALIEAAAEGPVLLTVDDAQWLDRPSLVALTFAVRRLMADQVAVLVAARSGPQTADLLPGVERIDVGPLSAADSRELLHQLYPQMPPTTADEVSEALGRIPLPMVEVGNLLPADILSGQRPVPSPVPVSRAVRQRYARGFDDLDERGRLAAVVLSVEETGDPTAVHEALQRLGLDASSLQPGEDAGLLTAGPAPSFVHPLARASVHAAATANELRRAHSALGQILRGRGDRALGAGHLAAAAVGPDPTLAEELEGIAVELADSEGGRTQAAVLARQAADLTVDPAARARLLVLAAECSDGPPAARLADAARALTVDPDLTARAVLVQLEFDPALQPADQVRITSTLDRLPLSADVAARRDVLSMWAAIRDADTSRLDQIAARYDSGPSAWPLLNALGQAFTFIGRHDRAVPLLHRAQAQSADLDARRLPPDQLVDWAVLPGWLGDDADHRARFRVMDDVLRATGRPERAGQAAFFSSERARREGRWGLAEALLRESIDLLGATLQPLGINLVRLACLLAYQGREDEVRELLDLAEAVFERHPAPWQSPWLDQARGALALTLGRPEEAIILLEPLRARPFLGRGARDAVSSGVVDLVQACVATGADEPAREATKDLQQRLDGVFDPLGPAVVARCRALTALGDPDEEYPSALEHISGTSEVFETARTQLLYGEHLRRTRRPRLAREPLTRAQATFERLHAHPWAERARRELAAAGDRPAAPAETTVELTAQELRIALAVTDGLTNAQIASSLFLSVKTVEFHLGNVYRKLGVRSRGGLASAMREQGITS